MAAAVSTATWVEWITSVMGGVSRQSYAATFPPDRFYCLLNELPLQLVQQNYRRNLRAESFEEELRLNPECRISPAENIPEEFLGRRDLLAGFAMQGAIAWVRDSARQALLPFWLGPELESAVSAVRRGESVRSAISPGAVRVLKAAGILVSDEDRRKTEDQRKEAIQQSGESFRRNGYAPIGDLIHPFHVAALRRYYRYMIRSGNIYLGDAQSSRRYVAHNEPVARFFHHQLMSTLSQIAGEPLKPSYVYLASYLSGAELKKHIDREQCEFSITLCVDFSPEPEMATPWPIQLDTSNGSVTVNQMIGDALTYRGTQLPHYRDRLPEGQSSTSIFFHYVGADFSGPLD